jgi:hypothetical protein
VGIRVDLVPESATNNDAFSFLHPTSADSAQTILIGLFANNLEVEPSVTHDQQCKSVGSRRNAEQAAQPGQHGRQSSPEETVHRVWEIVNAREAGIAKSTVERAWKSARWRRLFMVFLERLA